MAVSGSKRMAEIMNLVLKIVIVVVLTAIIIYEIVKYQEKGVPSNATRDEAYRTFQQFKSSKTKVYNDEILAAYTDHQNRLLGNLIRQKNELQRTLKAKMNETVSKIRLQDENGKRAGMDVHKCTDTALAELQNFEKDLSGMLERCYGDPKDAIDTHLGGVLARSSAHLEDVATCTSRSLYQCDVVADIDCYGYVLEEIQAVQEGLPDFANEMAAAIFALTEGFRLPCESLIRTNLAIYPDTVLDYVGDCIKSRTLSVTRKVC